VANDDSRFAPGGDDAYYRNDPVKYDLGVSTVVDRYLCSARSSKTRQARNFGPSDYRVPLLRTTCRIDRPKNRNLQRFSGIDSVPRKRFAHPENVDARRPLGKSQRTYPNRAIYRHPFGTPPSSCRGVPTRVGIMSLRR